MYGDDSRLSLTGELSMIFGVISLWCLTIPAIASIPYMYEAVGADRWKRGEQLGYVCLLLAGGHVFVRGIGGWLKPAG